MIEDKQLTLLGHLKELRNRLLLSLIAVAVATAPAFYLTNYVLLFFKSRAPGIDLVFTNTPEMLTTYMRVSIYLAIAMALPFLSFQAMKYISPALKEKEKRYLYPISSCFPRHSDSSSPLVRTLPGR
jgi:sec-independent protein translocase protein TatC